MDVLVSGGDGRGARYRGESGRGSPANVQQSGGEGKRKEYITGVIPNFDTLSLSYVRWKGSPLLLHDTCPDCMKEKKHLFVPIVWRASRISTGRNAFSIRLYGSSVENEGYRTTTQCVERRFGLNFCVIIRLFVRLGASPAHTALGS